MDVWHIVLFSLEKINFVFTLSLFVIVLKLFLIIYIEKRSCANFLQFIRFQLHRIVELLGKGCSTPGPELKGQGRTLMSKSSSRILPCSDSFCLSFQLHLVFIISLSLFLTTLMSLRAITDLTGTQNFHLPNIHLLSHKDIKKRNL